MSETGEKKKFDPLTDPLDLTCETCGERLYLHGRWSATHWTVWCNTCRVSTMAVSA